MLIKWQQSIIWISLTQSTPISKVGFVWGTSYWERSLMSNWDLAAGTGLDEILREISFDPAGLQTATVDLKHINKASYYI